MNRIIFAAGAAVLIAVSSAAFVDRNNSPSTDSTDTVAESNGFGLKVDLSERRLYVMRNGEAESSYPVAIGAPNFPTPRGNFKSRRVTWNPRWVPPDSKWARKKIPRGPGDPKNPMGRVKIFFREPDYYIHGTREVDSLGQAESHGCIRMRNSDAIAVAKLVMANGGAHREPGWFRRVLNRVTSTQDVRLGSPVSVQIVG